MPEQGDWKVADDFVIILDEYLEEKTDGAHTTDIDIRRLLLCQYALKQSPYNFDISLRILNIASKMNLSDWFIRTYKELGLKGIQLESMGYTYLKFSIESS